MTVYRGKTNKKRGGYIIQQKVQRSGQYFINVALVSMLVVVFLVNVLVSNSITAKQHVIGILKSDFNKKSSIQVTPTPDSNSTSIETLIEFASSRGMVESRDSLSLISDESFALSR